MNHPKFNWKTYPADYSELSKGSKMNVGELKDIRQPTENELVRMLCFNSGIRQTKELQNWSAWNGCVYVDVDYKNYINNNENATRPSKVFTDVYNYLVENHSSHFYYGELSRSKKGFHFIFYMENEYPTEERREALNYMANAAVIKAFSECGYKEAIEYDKVLDICTMSPYQICYITGLGKINDKCEGNWKINTSELAEIIERLQNKYKRQKTEKDGDYIYKSKLLKVNEVQSVPYIEHLVRRKLFRSLSTIFKDEDLKNNWKRCAELIPEQNGHSTSYYINAPYKNDWNESLTDNEYCDIDLLKMFGYEIKIDAYKKPTLKFDEVMTKIYEIINNGK